MDLNLNWSNWLNLNHEDVYGSDLESVSGIYSIGVLN